MPMTSQSDIEEIRLIEAQAAPTRFARGWHCLGLIRDFGDGKPHAINAFGQKLVVFADWRRRHQGSRQLLQAHGRRLLTGQSRATRSPARSTTGAGAATAAASWCRTPSAHRERRAPAAWTDVRRTACCSSGTTPKATHRRREVRIPRDRRAPPATNGPNGSGTHLIEGTNCREIIDNVVDMAHFFYIHGRCPPISRTSSRATSPRST